LTTFVVHHSVLAALWDYEHSSYRAAHRLLEEGVATGETHLASTTHLRLEVLDAVAASVAASGLVPDLVQALFIDVNRLLDSLAVAGALELVPTEGAFALAAFHASVAYGVSLQLTGLAALAQLTNRPLLVASQGAYRVYAALAAQIAGLEVQLLQ
jgi:hypothetical protein